MQNLLRRLTTQRLAALILFILLFALAIRIPVDTDTWWHLRSGEYILNHGSVPMTDTFSLTRFGQPWVDQSWGSQVILYSIYKLFGGIGQPGDGGNIGLALYTALLATGGMLLVYRACEGTVYLRAFVIVLAAATAAVFWSARPQMMLFFLSAVILYLLYLYKRRHIDRLWVIPLLMVVWVNLHAGFSIGFLLLGGTIIGEVLGRLFDKANRKVLSLQQIRKLVVVTVIAFAALIINPNTTQMWTYSFRTVGINFLQEHIQEWASLNFHAHETWPFVMLLFGTFAAVGLSGKRLDWTDLTLVRVFACFALYAGRNVATFALVAAPGLARHLDVLARERGIHFAPSRPPRGVALIVNWTLLILILLGTGLKIGLVLNSKTVAEAQSAGLPVEAAAYLNDAKPAGAMFNSYNWGGYLMFAAPTYPVFVDGRTDLYDDTLLNQWLETTQAQNWQQTFDQWKIRLVVIEKDSPLAQTLRQNANWTEVHTDNLAAIFTQKAS